MNIFVNGTFFVGMNNTPDSVEYLKTLGYSASDIESAFVDAAQLEALESRKKAYAVESDPFLLEAMRKDAAGDAEGAGIARAAALKAVQAVKERFPVAV